jgi:hypothetical protein
MFMLPKIESRPNVSEVMEDDLSDLRALYEESVADMLAEPELTDEEKQELLRQLTLPDDEWEPTVLPEGAEPLSVTLIKMRRGEGNILRGQSEGGIYAAKS